MKPSTFAYIRPDSVDAAIEGLVQAGEDAAILAGGQSLVPMLSMRLARPSTLVDINGVDDLSHIESTNGEIRLGACVRQRQAEHSDEIRRGIPLLARAMPHIAHVAIRNVGTVGGSLCHADPAAEIPAILSVLDAIAVVAGPDGTREVPVPEFIDGPFMTSLQPGELLREIRVKRQDATSGSAVVEFSKRHGDFALVGVGVTATSGPDAEMRHPRVVAFGCGSRPQRLMDVEGSIEGSPATDDVFADVADRAREEVESVSDVHASADYRRWLVGVLVARGLRQAVDDSRNQQNPGDGT